MTNCCETNIDLALKEAKKKGLVMYLFVCPECGSEYEMQARYHTGKKQDKDDNSGNK